MKEEKIISREDALLYRRMEAQELQRELEHLQAKIDAIKLESMEKIYIKENIHKT